MSMLAADYEDVFAGRPDDLETGASSLRTSAAAIGRATEALRTLVEGQSSNATDAISGVAEKTATDLEKAETRYSGTAGALQTFAVELRPIQSTARAAVTSAEFYETRTYRYETDISEKMSEITRAEAVGDPTEDLWDEYRSLNRQLGNAHQYVQDARDALHKARQDIRDAADRAISAIDTAIEDGSDSFGDDWNQFWSGVGEVFAAIGRWVSDVLDTIIKALIDILAVLLTIVIVLLIVVVALIVLGALLVASPLTMLALLIAGGLVIIALVVTLAIVRALSDTLKPDPTVTRKDDAPASDDRGGVDSAFDSSAEVDNLGNNPDGTGPDESGVIKVVKVIGPDGTVSWRVTLPSTQDWVMGPDNGLLGDAGATNDLDSNIALMLTPEMRTQYERAVMEALRQAGVKGGPDGDPILLVGFSQGGIMAGHLAANRSDSYNFQAIMVAGAPIDGMAIPDSTTVVSFQHEGDPVHQLDAITLNGGPKNTDNWITFEAAAEDPGHAHNAVQYGYTLEDNLDEVIKFAPELEDFFVGDDDDQSTYVDAEYYEWAE